MHDGAVGLATAAAGIRCRWAPLEVSAHAAEEEKGSQLAYAVDGHQIKSTRINHLASPSKSSSQNDDRWAGAGWRRPMGQGSWRSQAATSDIFLCRRTINQGPWRNIITTGPRSVAWRQRRPMAGP